MVPTESLKILEIGETHDNLEIVAEDWNEVQEQIQLRGDQLVGFRKLEKLKMKLRL